MHAAATPALARTTNQAALGNLLVVDEERAIREGCRELAQTVGYHTLIAENAEQARRLIETNRIDVVLLELRLSCSSGMELLRQIKAQRPEIIIVIMTGYATVRSAVEAMKNGAYEYLTKPFSLSELKSVLEQAGEEVRHVAVTQQAREQIQSQQGFGQIVGHAPEMERLYRIVGKAAQRTHPVLILGESGTGKELVARSIHYSGPGKDKPFIPVDCGSLVPTLIESELFGHVKGAFTGAHQEKQGLLAVADGGTVFLDEVGELPVDLQAKLLRVIQEHEIRPVGSTQRVPVSVRILAATNRDLEAAVAEGTFRRDLYFRLNVLTLRIPPLRERKQDIPLLAEHILEKLRTSSGVRHSLSDEALKALVGYDWPGNVRELENCLERACTMSSGLLLQKTDLSSAVQDALLQSSRLQQTLHRVLPLMELEKRAILAAIEQLNGDKLMAARLLGIGKTTLYRKLREYALQA